MISDKSVTDGGVWVGSENKAVPYKSEDGGARGSPDQDKSGRRECIPICAVSETELERITLVSECIFHFGSAGARRAYLELEFWLMEQRFCKLNLETKRRPAFHLTTRSE